MTKSRSSRGPYAKTAEKRLTIADAALAIVLESGHRALTTAAVAKRAGISERTMLYHFPSRDHLLVAALERSDELARGAQLDEEMIQPEGLEAIPRLTLNRVGGDAKIIHLYNALSAESDNPDHPANAYFHEHYERTLDIFTRLVSQQQQAGAAHPDLDPRRVARQLHSVWAGLQSLWSMDPSFDLVADLEDAFQRLTGQRELRARAALGELAGSL